MRIRYLGGAHLRDLRVGGARFTDAGDEADVPDDIAEANIAGPWFEPATTTDDDNDADGGV